MLHNARGNTEFKDSIADSARSGGSQAYIAVGSQEFPAKWSWKPEWQAANSK